MAVGDVKKIYQDIINDVCSEVREALSEEGYDDHTLQELKSLWLARLENSRALEPLIVSNVDQATTRDFRHSATGDTNNRQSTGANAKTNRLHPSTNAAVTTYTTNYASSTNFNSGIIPVTGAGTTRLIQTSYPTRPTNSANTSNQLDGANDEIILNKKKKKSKTIPISFQLDGTGPRVRDDDDEEDNSEAGTDVGDALDDDDDDDEATEDGKEDPNPLCSDDDVSDDEPAELFDTDNVVVCQYDKISRTKNKWRFILKSGIMNIEGRDFVFSKATGDADW